MATQKQGKKGKGGIILTVVGLVLVILGALWMAVIFPIFDKVPTGYGRTYYFEGNFQALNPATFSLDSFPIKQTLVQEAVGTQDGNLLIHEKRTVVRTDTGEDISARYGDESTLCVDRHTLKYMPECDERQRWGCWGPPRGLGEGDSYDLWNPGAKKPLTAKYVKADEFRGMEVALFTIDEKDIPIGMAPQINAPMYMSTTINFVYDPKTGAVIDNNSHTVTTLDMGGNRVTAQISDVRYAEQTIVDLMDVAKSAGRMLFWLETTVPWILIGVGAVLVIVGVLLIAKKRATPA